MCPRGATLAHQGVAVNLDIEVRGLEQRNPGERNSQYPSPNAEEAQCLLSMPGTPTRESVEQAAAKFLAFLGGYTIFGRSHSSVAQQIVIYIFARVCLAYAKLAIMPRANGSPMVRGADPYGPIMSGGREGGGGWGLIADDKTREMVMQSGKDVRRSSKGV